MFKLTKALLTGLAVLFSALSFGAGWPERPITLVVPFTPGTGIDLIARQLAASLPATLGQPLVVENVAGASGGIGTERVARAKPDGYTFLVTVSTHVMNRTLYKLLYQPVEDFVPVAQTSWGTLVLVSNPAGAVGSVAELITVAKKEPNKLVYGSPGVGTPHHLAMALFNDLTGTEMLHVPYKGTSGALQDMLGGRLDAMFLPIHVANAQIKAGKLKALAVGGPKRLDQLPNVPTLEESGLKGVNVDMWYGVMAAKGTPPEVIARMNTAVNQALRAPATATAFEAQGMVPATYTAQEFGELIKKDDERWAKVIQRAGITAN